MSRYGNLFQFMILLVLLILPHLVFAQDIKKATIISSMDSLGTHNGDSALRDKLIALGFDVASYRDGDFDSGQIEQAEYETNDLIVASESCSASKLRTILRFGFSVPTINFEVESVRNNHHALELINTVSTGNGWYSVEGENAYKLKIINGGHPLAAGFSSGEVIDLVSDPNCIDEDPFARGYIGWMVDDIGLIPIASINEEGADTALVLAGIEKGTLNVHGDQFNARYVQFNVNSFTATAWTADTDKLFQAAIEWVMENPTSVDDGVSKSTPTDFSLMQNYPNPFNPTTRISYALPEDSHVKVRIYNVLGNLVMDEINGEQSAGYHEFTFNASRLSSGLYFYTIKANEFTETKKMLLLK